MEIQIRTDICKIIEHVWITYSPAELVCIWLNLLIFKDRMRVWKEELRISEAFHIYAFSRGYSHLVNNQALLRREFPTWKGWRDLPRCFSTHYLLYPMIWASRCLRLVPSALGCLQLPLSWVHGSHSTSDAYLESHVGHWLAIYTDVTWKLGISDPVAIVSYGKFISCYFSVISQYYRLALCNSALFCQTRSSRLQIRENSPK
jgi:hypothetical protein